MMLKTNVLRGPSTLIHSEVSQKEKTMYYINVYTWNLEK